MKNDKLVKAMGYVDDKYLEAADSRKKQTLWRLILRRVLWFVLIMLIIAVVAFTVGHFMAKDDPANVLLEKPVIYLYPEERTQVDITLELDGTLGVTYPVYDGHWRVTASPDGTLTDGDGREYVYLFWEGEGNFTPDFSRGFCVRGEDTADFLRRTLSDAGLTDREANDFIVWWLPRMTGNEYNVITFAGPEYADAARLTVNPAPDSVLRVFMAWYGTDKEVDITPQEVEPFVRTGFTLVEWGGGEVGGG